MNNSRSKNSILNIGCAFILQMITALSGLILPRLIIPHYGSEVNGLIVSITQFLSYIALLEGGAEGVMRASLYKPLADKDNTRVSMIFKSATIFFRKIALFFIVYLIAICIFYPMLVAQNFDSKFTLSMIIILSVGTFLQYYFSLPYISLLSADQKVRIVYLIDSIIILLNLILSCVLISNGASIQLVKIVSSLLFVLKPLFFIFYTKTKYKLNTKIKPEKSLINQRWNGMVHHLAYFIHINTDVVIITLFLGTKAVSVYSIYYAIVSGIERIISSISVGSAASIGNLLNMEKKDVVNSVIDKFEFIQTSITTILYTTTAVMIIPFIKLYTTNMIDTNYIKPYFAYALVIAEALYCIRLIYSTITLNANKYKETQNGAIAECITNVILSICLVWKFEILGVAIGTAVGMLVRTIFDVNYLSKNLIYRPKRFFIKNICTSMIISLSSICVSTIFVNLLFNDTWISWIITAIVCLLIIIIISIGIYLLFYRDIVSKIFVQFKKLIKLKKN